MADNNSEYRGCWNCIYHDDVEGFETHCAYSKSNNVTVYLRCPAWVNKENTSLNELDENEKTWVALLMLLALALNEADKENTDD